MKRLAGPAPVQLEDLSPAGYFIDKVKALVGLHCWQGHYRRLHPIQAEVLQQQILKFEWSDAFESTGSLPHDLTSCRQASLPDHKHATLNKEIPALSLHCWIFPQISKGLLALVIVLYTGIGDVLPY